MNQDPQFYNQRNNIPTLVIIPDQVEWVSCGVENTYCLTSNAAYSWGVSQQSKITQTPTLIKNISGKVNRIVSAKDHSFAWSTQSGEVFVWGSNKNGKLGTNAIAKEPVLFDIFTEASQYGWKLIKLAAGWEHSLALVEVEEENKIFVWGSNVFQQLGFDTSDKYIASPHQLELEYKVKDIYAQHNYTMAIDIEGKVLSWGSNEFGRLGLQTFAKSMKLPQQIENLKNISKLGLGVYHVLALDEEGSVFSWGRGLQGQLGLGNAMDSPSPKKIPNLPRMTQICCGESHSLTLSIKGEVFAFGLGSYGQLGTGDFKQYDSPQMINIEQVKFISCGRVHSAIINDKGQLFTFGSNQHGQLGEQRKDSALFSTPIVERRVQKQQQMVFGDFYDIIRQTAHTDQQAAVFEQTDEFMNKVELMVSNGELQNAAEELRKYQELIENEDHTSKFLSDLMERLIALLKQMEKK